MAWELTGEDASTGGSDQSSGLPGYLQTADDAVRTAANAVTFGMADRLAGYLSGTGTDAEVKRTEQARERSPYATLAGDVAGSVAIPGLGGEALAAKLGGKLGGRMLGYGLEGAAVGAGQGAGNTYTGNVPDYVQNALIGGALGGATGGIMGGVFGPMQIVNAQIPRSAEQKAATDFAYDALRDNPTPYSAPHFRAAADNLEQALQKDGFIREYAPGAFTAVDRMRASEGLPNAIVTPADIDAIRKGINRIPTTDLSKTDRAAGRIVKNALDDFMMNPPPGAVLQGGQQAARDAADTAALARALHGNAERTLLMERLGQRMEDLTQGHNSGRNFENVSRRQINNLTNPLSATSRAKMAGFNPEERTAIEGLKYPGFAVNSMRTVGNMLGGGGGAIAPLAAAGGIGTAAGYYSSDPSFGAMLGAAAIPAGFLLRNASNRLARQRFQDVQDLVAKRSPLYQQRAAGAGMTTGPSVLSPATISNMRDAIAYQMLKHRSEQSDLGD